jgi:hypothetical protein
MAGQRRQSARPGGSSAYHGWRERTKENLHNNCHACGALKQHPAIDCKLLARRLRYSAAHHYDSANPWAWPPEDVYTLKWGQWEWDRDA